MLATALALACIGYRADSATRQTRSSQEALAAKEGSYALLILLAKSEIRTIYVRHEPKNPGCQGANSHETDFASSITFGEEGGYDTIKNDGS